MSRYGNPDRPPKRCERCNKPSEWYGLGSWPRWLCLECWDIIYTRAPYRGSILSYVRKLK